MIKESVIRTLSLSIILSFELIIPVITQMTTGNSEKGHGEKKIAGS